MSPSDYSNICNVHLGSDVVKKNLDKHRILFIPCGMILSSLGLSSLFLFLSFCPQNILFQLNVIHAYILISLFILNRCETL